jgi:hypothetical protein
MVSQALEVLLQARMQELVLRMGQRASQVSEVQLKVQQAHSWKGLGLDSMSPVELLRARSEKLGLD